MAESATGNVAEQEQVPAPWTGVAVASLAALAGAGVSLWLWPELPEMVPSGRAGLDGEPSLTPRWLFAAAMPGVILLLVAVLALGSRVGLRFQRSLQLPTPWSGRRVRVLMDLFLVLMGAFMLAVHVIVLHGEAGRDLPLSTEHLVVLLMAAFSVALGLTVPLMRTRDGLDSVAVRWWERARWPVGVGLMLTGVVTGLVGLLVPGTLWSVLMGVLMMPAILLGCAFPFVGDQSWRNESRSKA
ncbi:SdpI family protein [Nocardiopsis valliformis]|uniref:hypothetical protein n=1 Tax=Nocardiopsis valliformis TaxID=239974 RepID=UPI0003775EE7|nr:hypothetical protein [Nocardiopsis valliformis]